MEEPQNYSQPLQDLTGMEALPACVHSASAARLRRYTLAEESLRICFSHSTSESNAVELQIRTLKKATQALKEHAQEAQQRAEQLKSHIKSCGDQVGSQELARMQREWWYDELSTHAAEEVSTQLHAALSQINSDTHTSSIAIREASRREVNLAHFFASSQSKARIRKRHAVRLSIVDHAPRRTTVNGFSPLQLKPGLSPLVRKPDFVKAHTQSLSFVANVPAERKPPQLALSSSSLSPSPTTAAFADETRIQTPPVPDLARPESSAASVSSQSQSSNTDPSTPPPTTATTQRPLSQLSSLSVDPGGYATIFHSRPVHHRTKSQVCANLSIDIPDYAKALLEDFDVAGDMDLFDRLPVVSKPRVSVATTGSTRELYSIIGSSESLPSPSSLPDIPAQKPKRQLSRSALHIGYSSRKTETHDSNSVSLVKQIRKRFSIIGKSR